MTIQDNPPRPSATVRKGLPLKAVLELDCLAGTRVVAGTDGLGRLVSRLNVMEVPDILAWVKPEELLLTTGYPLRRVPGSLASLIASLADRGLAGVGVKLGRYLDELPADMIREADKVGLPVLSLPSDVAFDDIINQVLAAVLDNQAELLARAEDAHRALVEIVLSGGNLDLLCEELVRILGGAVLISSQDGTVVSQAGSPELLDRALGLDFMASREWPKVSRIFRDGVQQDGNLSYAVARIAAGSLDHGRLMLFSGSRHLAADDIHILERAATVAALAITKSQAVSAVDNKYKADFLRDVVTGRAGSSQRVASHARSLGWDVARRLAVLSIQLDVTGKGEELSVDELREVDDRLARAWQRAVRDHDPRAPAAGIRGEVIVLLPVGENNQEQIRRVVRTLAKRARSDRTGPNRSASVGISRPTETIEDLPDAYQQAQRAVRAGRKLNGAGAVTDFDSLGVFRLLSLIPDDSELVAFAAETLGPLAGEPTPEYDDLLKTLTVLLEMGMNISKTARALHFHYNTLRYRIAKLERLLGPFTTDAHLRLRISLALEVREMRGI